MCISYFEFRRAGINAMDMESDHWDIEIGCYNGILATVMQCHNGLGMIYLFYYH